jgi:hypothetical protein
MYANLNFFYQVTGPLHNHRGYEDQMATLKNIIANMTTLRSEMETAKSRMDEVEQNMHKQADKFFKDWDRHIEMDAGEKSQMFEDNMGDMTSSIQMAKKKFQKVEEKMRQMTELTAHFHESTDQLESLYRRDIEQRQKRKEQQMKQLQLHLDSDEPTYVSGMNLEQIDEIFDAIESEENRSVVRILLSVANLSLLGVIGLTIYKFGELNRASGGKNRMD